MKRDNLFQCIYLHIIIKNTYTASILQVLWFGKLHPLWHHRNLLNLNWSNIFQDINISYFKNTICWTIWYWEIYMNKTWKKQECLNQRHTFISATECEFGFYGGKCIQHCGHCLDINDCNKTTGVCSNGCQSHWNGSKCDGNFQSNHICLYVPTTARNANSYNAKNDQYF